METGEQGEAAKLESTGGRERLTSWKMLGAGRGCLGGGGWREGEGRWVG